MIEKSAQEILDEIKKRVNSADLQNVDDGIIFYSFKEIYESQKSQGESPLYESFALQSFAIHGIYGIESELIAKISAEHGMFKTMLIFDDILSRSRPYRRFVELYKEYKTQKESVGAVLGDFLHKVEIKLSSLNFDDLTKIFEQFTEEAAKIEEVIK